jgi:hypothetical protein
MTDMDMITWNLENIRMDNLHFDSTGLGWANINCLLNEKKPKPKLNALTRFVTKQLSKKQSRFLLKFDAWVAEGN